MKQTNSKRLQFHLFTFLILFSFSSSILAQSKISTKIQSNQALIEQQDLQSPLNKLQHNTINNPILNDFPEAIILKPINAVIHSITEHQADYLNLEIPGPNNKSINLLLYKYDLHTADYILRTGTGKTFNSKGVFYHGVVKNQEHSVVAISIFDNEIIGMIQMNNQQYTITKIRKDRAEHMLYNNKILEGKNEFTCGTNLEDHYKREENKSDFRVSNPDNCVNMYLEVDYDIFQDKGSLSATSNYIDAVMNEVSVLYSNESINFGVSEMVVWDVNDPYSGPSSGNYLDQFRNQLNGVYNGDLAHLIGYGGGGGVAYVNVLCNAVYGIGYSGINSSYNTVPTYSWTVEVLTHEIGHNLGSQHTHDCAWNGNNTAIDGCGPAAGYSSGCNAPVPAKGTIMSYCHLVSGIGIDFNLGFGPQPGDRIRDRVYNASCLSSCAPCETVGQPCDDGDVCTTNDIYDANCNCIGTFEDDDSDGVCNANDQCPGADDGLDTDNDGTPDCIECSGSYSSTNFNSSPLTHTGSGSGSTTINYPFGTNDISFTVSGISQKLNGNPSKKYIEEVTISYIDGNGINQTYGVYTAPGSSSASVNISGLVSEVTVSLKDVLDGSTTGTMSINLSSATACEPSGGCPDDDNDGVCNADDICPGGNDNIDTDNDGIPDFCDSDSCPNQTGSFTSNPLDHQGSGSSNSNINFSSITTDATFTITNIGSKINGNPSNRYIDKVTIDYVDGNGSTINYGTYLGDNVSSVNVSIAGAVQSVTATLEDAYDGDTGSRTISVNFSDVSSCFTPAASPRKLSSDINIYPNPAIQSVFIDFGNKVKNTNIRIFSILGENIYNNHINDEQIIEIDLNSFLNESVYFILIEAEDGTVQTKKLLISK